MARRCFLSSVPRVDNVFLPNLVVHVVMFSACRGAKSSGLACKYRNGPPNQNPFNPDCSRFIGSSSNRYQPVNIEFLPSLPLTWITDLRVVNSRQSS